MIYVLDTSIVSVLMRSEPAASHALLRARPGSVLLPQPVIAEIEYGLARLPSSRRRKELDARFHTLLSSLARALWTDDTSHRFGEIKADLERRGERVDDFDVAIAAHAKALDATVVTRNRRHFDRIRSLFVDDWT